MNQGLHQPAQASLFKEGDATIFCDELEVDSCCSLERYRSFAAVEIVVGHVRDTGLGTGGPRLHHPMRVALGKLLDRSCCAAVRVPFTQDRVDGTPEALGESGLKCLLGIVLRLFRVVRDFKPFVLQLLDRFLQLGDGGANIRQLDDVGCRVLGEFAKLGQVVRNLLIFSQVVGEISDNSARKGDVSGFDINTGSLEEIFTMGRRA